MLYFRNIWLPSINMGFKKYRHSAMEPWKNLRNLAKVYNLRKVCFPRFVGNIEGNLFEKGSLLDFAG